MATTGLWKGRGRILVGAAAGVALLYAVLTFAYTTFQDDVSGAPAPAFWASTTVTWNLNPSTPNNNVNTTQGTSPLTIPQALTNAFNIWPQTQWNGATLNSLTLTQGADSTLTLPDVSDCLNVIGFSDTSPSDFPTGTIAFTDVATATGTPPFTYPCTVGGVTTQVTCPFRDCMIDGDMEFNPNQPFSTSTPPLTNNFDLQSVASHEFGHLLGLDHSGIAHTMMFPFGDTGASQQRALAIDDLMGIAFLFDSSNFFQLTGAVSGKISQSGSGIFAAHVVAVDATTGNAVVDGLTNADGTYILDGVPPGTYNVLVLPLAPDYNSGVYTLYDFSGWSCGYSENSAPCCQPGTPGCIGTLNNPTNYTGKFY